MVRVYSIGMYWRYAVGPLSRLCPAVPFFLYKNAKEFFEECKRDIPDYGVVIYKRKMDNTLVTVETYEPNAKPAPARSGAREEGDDER